MQIEELIKGLINDIVILQMSKDESEKDTIKAFLDYKLKYLKGLIKEL